MFDANKCWKWVTNQLFCTWLSLDFITKRVVLYAKNQQMMTWCWVDLTLIFVFLLRWNFVILHSRTDLMMTQMMTSWRPRKASESRRRGGHWPHWLCPTVHTIIFGTPFISICPTRRIITTPFMAYPAIDRLMLMYFFALKSFFALKFFCS